MQIIRSRVATLNAVFGTVCTWISFVALRHVREVAVRSQVHTFNLRVLHSGQPLRDLRCDLLGPIISKNHSQYEECREINLFECGYGRGFEYECELGFGREAPLTHIDIG